MINRIFKSFCTVQTYDLSHIHFTTAYYQLTMWPAPIWLDRSVGKALHRYRRNHGLESRSDLNVFQALISQLLKFFEKLR